MSEEGKVIRSPSIATGTINGKHKFSPQTTATPSFQISPLLAKRCHESAPDAIPIILQGSKNSTLIIGRGHDATIKIGKSNKCVSREHVAIEHKPHLNGFELTILSPNGALIDHIIFDQGEHVPVIEGTLIEIVGTKLLFKGLKEEELPKKEYIPTPSPQQLQQEEEAKVATSITKTTTLTTTTTTTTTLTTKTVTEKSTARVNVKSDTPKICNTATRTKSMSLKDEIVQILVTTRKSTMTCTDIKNRIQGHTFLDVSKILSESPMIGCIPRSGKLADGSLKEDLYYYKPELDVNVERRKKYSDMGRSARKCTMKDTQYFFRIPPKLPSQKASNNKIRKRVNYAARERQEDEELISNNNSSDDASDMEVYELFKDV